MTAKNKKKVPYKPAKLSHDQINDMFMRFSFPFIQFFISTEEVVKAIKLSKLLWMRFITATDSLENIQNDLKKISSDHREFVVALESLYFNVMRTVLSDSEIHRLLRHFSDESNITELNLISAKNPIELY